MAGRTRTKHIADTPSIQEFDSLPAYLRHISDRRNAAHVTLTALAKSTGLSQPYWSQVAAGTLRPTQSAATRLAQAMKLNATETKHLLRLCALQRSASVEQRIRTLDKLTRNPEVAEIWQLDATLLSYLSDWRNVAVRHLANVPGQRPDATAIARRLRRHVTAKQVERILARLVELGLLVLDAGGAVALHSPEIRTGPQIHHEIVRAFHDQNADNARWALANIDAQDRSFASVTSQVDPAALPALWAKVQELRAQIAQFTRDNASDSGVLVQINLQAFPLSYADAQKDGAP